MTVLFSIIILFWNSLKEYDTLPDPGVQLAMDYMPEANAGQIYHKPNFSISYVEKYEIPEWVMYKLTVGMLNAKKSKRDQDFQPDQEIRTGSAHYHDYKQSGYRRGHMVPAADMAWDKTSMDATFLMSNIVPMLEPFNDGIWLELEHNVRDWARRYGEIVVIAGPVFKDTLGIIGSNQVLVPRYFFKSVWTLAGKKPKVVGFLFDQTDSSDLRLEDYIVSIDSIEQLSGIDLFNNLYGDWDAEIMLEKSADPDQKDWTFNEKWYLERIR